MNSFEELEDLKVLCRTVYLHYELDLPQSDIARKLSLTPSRVSRLLKRARQERWIRVSYHLPDLPKLAMDLAARYKLKDAVVIPAAAGSSEAELKNDLGRAAARYFEKYVVTGLKVGISCGYSLFAFAENLREGLFEELTLYPLAAESTSAYVDVTPNTLVGFMAAKYRTNKVTAWALNPSIMDDSNCPNLPAWRVELGNENRKVLERAGDVDISLVSIGTVIGSAEARIPGFWALARFAGISEEDLIAEGAVGETNYQLFNADGEPIRSKNKKLMKLTELISAVSLDRLSYLSKHKRVIAVAGGMSKLAAIKAALKGRFFNTLVTDDEVARALLD
jgi:deoxyribonucleoside regulator